MSTFDPGPPRDSIAGHEMPAEDDVPGILQYLEDQGLKLVVDETSLVRGCGYAHEGTCAAELKERGA
jgi:hypothetical protein